ncbi:hypothetical protein HUT19_27420 [Streptomyces sp. NA02950]|uniref:hypothetical protein n=1 Tax=Streptomyces sp. NA02950 TaxID=2742137 RepID=UPI00159136D7|nr:hypothetical protein [Streptomyces sp. NA02950]QKV95014.1 hypothetical protein HUT19_27420 [Streptomyces sp. NA02950]
MRGTPAPGRKELLRGHLGAVQPRHGSASTETALHITDEERRIGQEQLLDPGA